MNRICFSLLFLIFTTTALGQDSISGGTDTSAIEVISDSMHLQTNSNQSRTIVREDFGRKRNASSKSSYFFIGLGTFLLFGIVRFLYSRYIKELVSILSRSTLGRMSSKESLWHNLMPRWLFLAMYFLAGGYIIGRLIEYFTSMSENPITFWLWGVLISFSAYTLKFLMIHAVALVFRFNKMATSFFNHLSVVNQLMGLILLPVCGILMIAPQKLANILLMIAAVLLFISLIFKLLINIGYVRNLPRVNYFHFILYLCTLEFIPLAVFARYVYDGFGA